MLSPWLNKQKKSKESEKEEKKKHPSKCKNGRNIKKHSTVGAWPADRPRLNDQQRPGGIRIGVNDTALARRTSKQGKSRRNETKGRRAMEKYRWWALEERREKKLQHAESARDDKREPHSGTARMAPRPFVKMSEARAEARPITCYNFVFVQILQ